MFKNFRMSEENRNIFYFDYSENQDYGGIYEVSFTAVFGDDLEITCDQSNRVWKFPYTPANINNLEHIIRAKGKDMLSDVGEEQWERFSENFYG